MPQVLVMTDGFGARLRELRKNAGLTQQKLANKAGISLSTLTSLEQGREGEPTWKTVRLLAKALGVSVAEFETPDEPTGVEPPNETAQPAPPKKPKPKK